MTLVIFGVIITNLGVAIVQDGIASIVFYVNKKGETWMHNHIWRLIRILFGLILIGIGFTQIILVLKDL